MSRPLPDDVALSTTLAALANPVRLALLRELRAPKTLSDIRVASDEEGAERPLSRQAVRQHLDRLLEVGAVGRLEGERAAGSAYLVEHRKLFAAAEQLRSLAALRPVDDALADETVVARPTGAGPVSRGPRLVLVRGLGEGTVFPLAPPEEEWIIGRRRELAVGLDYDPFVSSENTILRRARDGAFTVEDVPGSRNGTLVNFTRLREGASQKLKHGDVIGAGLSSLVFWTD